jgi:hypothetical protein
MISSFSEMEFFFLTFWRSPNQRNNDDKEEEEEEEEEG